MGMLRTVTLNTGFDDYYTVSGLAWGGLGRMHGFRSVCSGKGISCARTAVALGVPTKAYALIGIDDADHYSTRLEDEGMDHFLVPVPGATRHNLTLLDATAEKVGAHFVAKGFTLGGPEQVSPMMERVLADVVPGDVVTLNGSTPAGLPDDTWAELAAGCLARGARVVVDAQQAAFRAALNVPGVTAFKPNDDEILALAGIQDLPADRRVPAALDALTAAGTAIPLVSLGSRGVATLRGGVPVRTWCPVAAPVQSVMAGDAFVAGLAQGLLAEADPEACIARALAAAAAHVAGLEGPALREQAERNVAAVRSERLT